MFRGTKKSELDPKNFGAGSIVQVCNEHYLVIATSEFSVSLLCLATFSIVAKAISVEDPNFISEDECRTLISGRGNTAFSDCDFIPSGLKNGFKALSK